MAMSNTVSVHIDELVLIGIRPADRGRVAQALQTELTRLLRESPMRSGIAPSEPVTFERVVTPTARLAAAPDVRSVGRLAAAQVHSYLRSAR
jgi:hypothetical protein